MLPFQVPTLRPTGLVESGLNVVSWAVMLPAPVTVKENVVAPLSVSVPVKVAVRVGGGGATTDPSELFLHPPIMSNASDAATMGTRRAINRCMEVLRPRQNVVPTANRNWNDFCGSRVLASTPARCGLYAKMSRNGTLITGMKSRTSTPVDVLNALTRDSENRASLGPSTLGSTAGS